MARLIAVTLLACLIGLVAAQKTQATYTIGGTNVVFGFVRVDNVTTMFWPRFSAVTPEATGLGGRLNSGLSATLPDGYGLLGTFAYGTEALVRCLNLPSGIAYAHLSLTPPVIVFSPINEEDSDWAPEVTVVIESGSLTYANV